MHRKRGIRSWSWFVGVVALLAAGSCAQLGARCKTSPSCGVGGRDQGPDRISGFEDGGTFRFYVNEEVLVTSDFVWEKDGTYQSEYTLAMAGQEVTTTLEIKTDEEGLWTEMAMVTAGGPVSIVREDTLASVIQGEETAIVALKPRTVLFENFNPALMSLAVRAYDRAKGGKQTFPLFIIPRVVMEGSLERGETFRRTVSGGDLDLTTYVYGLPGVDVTLWVDSEGKVLFADVPAQRAVYVREGYEALWKPEPEDPLLSAPEFEVRVVKNMGVPMRDGIELATDLYRPAAEGQFPVILVRTPYRKEMSELEGRFFARRGYAYAVQDCRGRFSSPGEWEPFIHEADDGYDTIEWLAVQPWSTGKVGMIGASYLGWVQWWAARNRPPHLVTIVPNVSPPDPFYNIPYEYGVFFLLGAIWWADVLESEATGDISGERMREIAEKKYARLLRHLPVVELDDKVLGSVNPYWRKWIAHPTNDAYWEPASFLDHLENLDIPVLHQSGWFDGDGIGSKLNYLRMAFHGHPSQKLILGPWGHSAKAHRRVRERDFGEEAIVDLDREYLRWLDRWLKGVANGIDEEPLVSVFVMGSNRWLKGDTYPLPQTRMTPVYLTSGGNANTSQGDGRLTTKPHPPRPAALPRLAHDEYVYDPGDPTPSPYFYVSPEDLSEEGDEGAKVYDVEDERRKRREYYARVNEERQDILVYDSPPVEEPLTVAGPIEATLYASTTGKDTDWFMRLSEVEADGTVFPLVEGKIRARHLYSMEEPELLEPGDVYEYRLDLWHTGITIPPGHKLRVEVASASFPMFSRNLNTGGHNETEAEYEVVRQAVYHDHNCPSHVLLPVIPNAEELFESY